MVKHLGLVTGLVVAISRSPYASAFFQIATRSPPLPPLPRLHGQQPTGGNGFQTSNRVSSVRQASGSFGFRFAPELPATNSASLHLSSRLFNNHAESRDAFSSWRDFTLSFSNLSRLLRIYFCSRAQNEMFGFQKAARFRLAERKYCVVAPLMRDYFQLPNARAFLQFDNIATP